MIDDNRNLTYSKIKANTTPSIDHEISNTNFSETLVTPYQLKPIASKTSSLVSTPLKAIRISTIHNQFFYSYLSYLKFDDHIEDITYLKNHTLEIRSIECVTGWLGMRKVVTENGLRVPLGQLKQGFESLGMEEFNILEIADIVNRIKSRIYALTAGKVDERVKARIEQDKSVLISKGFVKYMKYLLIDDGEVSKEGLEKYRDEIRDEDNVSGFLKLILHHVKRQHTAIAIKRAFWYLKYETVKVLEDEIHAVPKEVEEGAEEGVICIPNGAKLYTIHLGYKMYIGNPKMLLKVADRFRDASNVTLWLRKVRKSTTGCNEEQSKTKIQQINGFLIELGLAPFDETEQLTIMLNVNAINYTKPDVYVEKIGATLKVSPTELKYRDLQDHNYKIKQEYQYGPGTKGEESFYPTDVFDKGWDEVTSKIPTNTPKTEFYESDIALREQYRNSQQYGTHRYEPSLNSHPHKLNGYQTPQMYNGYRYGQRNSRDRSQRYESDQYRPSASHQRPYSTPECNPYSAIFNPSYSQQNQSVHRNGYQQPRQQRSPPSDNYYSRKQQSDYEGMLTNFNSF